MTERYSKQHPQAFAAWASFIVFLAAAYFGAAAVMIYSRVHLGWPSNRPISSWGEMLVTIAVPLLLIVVATYVAGICWLVFARFVFSWQEASMIVCHGPTTRFDRWLLNAIVPGGPAGSDGQAAAMPSNHRWKGP